MLILLVKYTKSDCTCEFYYFYTCGWFKLGNNPPILTTFLVILIQSIHYNSPFALYCSLYSLSWYISIVFYSYCIIVYTLSYMLYSVINTLIVITLV